MEYSLKKMTVYTYISCKNVNKAMKMLIKITAL